LFFVRVTRLRDKPEKEPADSQLGSRLPPTRRRSSPPPKLLKSSQTRARRTHGYLNTFPAIGHECEYFNFFLVGGVGSFQVSISRGGGGGGRNFQSKYFKTERVRSFQVSISQEGLVVSN
jgi:hypothetical protein